MRHEDITEVSDPHQLTVDAPEPAAPEIRVLKGEPTDSDLAALITVLTGLGGGAAHPGPQELNLWGHPVDKLRYPVTSWQRVTLLERTHLRR
ncbi:MAG: acyl-CoA carboxylase subunit epsilon [Actinomycetia bacterium]|nr:acyl-CoA carboxylase subunit epsilon [Actinomycetes bacterium]